MSSLGSTVASGGKIDEMISSLVAGANDADHEVRVHIARSLQEIGKHQPNAVLGIAKDAMEKNTKLPKEHRVILLNIMYQVLEMRRDQVNPTLSNDLRALAISEMTKDKEVVPDWQGAASSVLVSLGQRFPTEVLEELMSRFTPGTVPHYFIMKTLGDFVVANPQATVPRVKEILARITPVLSSVKAENLKWVFASGIGHICEAILYYVANCQGGEGAEAAYSSDVFPAYEMLLTHWLSAKEPKVRLAAVQALGSLASLMGRAQLEGQLPQLVPLLLALYKKEREHLPITQGFHSLLFVSVKGGSRVLETLGLLGNILNTLHPLACQPPDGSSSSVKNHNELYRCYQTIALVFSDTLLSHLLEKLQSKEPKVRLGTLAILRHLVTHAVGPLEDKRGVLVSGVKPLILGETLPSLRYELAQLVIAMAHHGYLVLEGGENLVEFIILNCSITEEEIAKNPWKGKDEVSLGELRSLSDNVLNLMTTTLAGVHPVLWPYLLECVVPLRFAPALASVAKAVAFLASLKRREEASDYILDFDRLVNVPKPPAIIARLFVALNAPLRRGNVGIHLLDTLVAIGPILHPSICDMWDSSIPKLRAFLESNSDEAKWKQSLWEDLLLRLLSETIRIANDPQWTSALGDQLAAQLSLYDSDPLLKRVAFKHLGLVLQKTTHKEFLRAKLSEMLASVRVGVAEEAQGCAEGFGYCAAAHLDLTLEKLQTPPPVLKKKKSGFLSFLSKDSQDSSSTELSSTVILAYGYITAYAAPQLITSRVDITILTTLRPTMLGAKSFQTKMSVVKTIELIAKTMHPSHLKKEYVLKQRDELLKILLGYTTPLPGKEKSSELSAELRVAVMGAMTALINLEPVLSVEVESAVLERLMSFLSAEGEGGEGGVEGVLSAVLHANPSLPTLSRLLLALEPHLAGPLPLQRSRAVQAAKHLLQAFQELLRLPGARGSGWEGGSWVAVLVPRTCDVEKEVRVAAMQGIQCALHIQHSILHPPEDPTVPTPLPAELEVMSQWEERLREADGASHLAVAAELADLLGRVLGKLGPFLQALLKGLTDRSVPATRGACVVWHQVVLKRGQDLSQDLPALVEALVATLPSIGSEQTLNGALHALRTLASHWPLGVLGPLLGSSLPHSAVVVRALHALAGDEPLLPPLLEHLFEQLNYAQLYDLTDSGKTPCHPPMAATCTLGEVMTLDDWDEIVLERYPLFCGSLLLRLGTSHGMPTASEQAISTFKQFMRTAKEEDLPEVMEEGNLWEQLKGPQYTEAITRISGCIASSRPRKMEGLFQFLHPFMQGNFIEQRIVAATVIAEFVSHCRGNPQLLRMLIDCLLNSLMDSAIKLYALRGLGNIVGVGADEANEYAPTILDALLSALDDPAEELAMEAMKGLAKVFALVEESRMVPILVNICHRIRPALAKPSADIRAAAFTLFGALHRFGSGGGRDPFYEQLQQFLPPLLLHLRDDSPLVCQATTGALRLLAPLIRDEAVEKLLLSLGERLDYPEFLNEVTQLLLAAFPTRANHYVMTCVGYFQSAWPAIQANAALAVGFFLGHLPPTQRKVLNPGLVSRALIGLLAAKDAPVRRACADAMSLLHSY